MSQHLFTVTHGQFEMEEVYAGPDAAAAVSAANDAAHVARLDSLPVEVVLSRTQTLADGTTLTDDYFVEDEAGHITDAAGNRIGYDDIAPGTADQVKPPCQLSNTDGNVFAVIATVSRCLKNAGQRDRAEEWQEAATRSKSYDEVLQRLFDYVDAS